MLFFRTTAGYRILATGFSCHLAKTLLLIVASKYEDDRKRYDIATICEKSFRQMPRTYKKAGITITTPSTGDELQKEQA